jgi:hypothetical protein
MNFKGGYRLTPHWFMGSFLDVNNTRNYSSQAFGFNVRYVPRPMPLTFRPNESNLPNFSGIRPLMLP